MVIAGYPYKEVDHEEDVESEVDLLCCTVGPFLARLYCFPASNNSSHNFFISCCYNFRHRSCRSVHFWPSVCPVPEFKSKMEIR